MRILRFAVILSTALAVACSVPNTMTGYESILEDGSPGSDWPAYGRTYGEQHFSPLADISANNTSRLGLKWFIDLSPSSTTTIPLAVDGVLYFATGWSVIHAVDARNGKELWTYDPKVAEVGGPRLRQGWGTRGIAYCNNRIYVGTPDGRLLAIDARTGELVWGVDTLMPGDLRYITGAPRIFDDKVIIGHGGGDSAAIRGYVTAYDARSGQQLWRFYTVPGNPALGFEDDAQAMAAKTWAGEWWKHGGGGNVWNAITYDKALSTILIGTGNGSPWNRKIRSAGKGDNLFLSSIVALDAKTGNYKWHYQINPGEQWDYNASMDMHLADLEIAGTMRKVVVTAPKNGFVYVIDRTNGKLISAEKIAKVTWASKIDLATGRPVENPAARYPNGQSFILWPSQNGAHSWMPSAFSPQTKLVYVPVNELGSEIGDKGITKENWHRTPGGAYDMAVNLNLSVDDPLQGKSFLVAWDPVRQRAAWKVPTPNVYNGGVLATAGNLVFQGHIDGSFNAYNATTGDLLWKFETGSPILAAPIAYSVDGVQHVTVITGIGNSPAGMAGLLGRRIDYRNQAKRVLTFILDGNRRLPPLAKPEATEIPDDPEYRADQTKWLKGAEIYGRRCVQCHGLGAVAGGAAPDLRESGVALSAEAFASVVHEGALLSSGMPRFENLRDDELDAVRHYLRAEAAAARLKQQQ